MNKGSCEHERTQLIAKDKDAEFVECLDCGAIVDVREQPDAEPREPSSVDDSLSDA